MEKLGKCNLVRNLPYIKAWHLTSFKDGDGGLEKTPASEWSGSLFFNNLSINIPGTLQALIFKLFTMMQ